MRPGQKMAAAILMWSAISAGALAAADEAGAAPGPPAKAAPDVPKERRHRLPSR